MARYMQRCMEIKQQNEVHLKKKKTNSLLFQSCLILQIISVAVTACKLGLQRLPISTEAKRRAALKDKPKKLV